MTLPVKSFLYEFFKTYPHESITDMLKTFEKDPRETKRSNINLLIKFLLNNHYFEEKEYSIEEATKIMMTL
jgi:hypothetical protein